MCIRDSTPEEFAIFEEMRKIVKANLKGKGSVSIEAVLMEMCARLRNIVGEAAKQKAVVVFHVDAASNRSWVQTGRGNMPVCQATIDEALEHGELMLAGSELCGFDGMRDEEPGVGASMFETAHLDVTPAPIKRSRKIKPTVIRTLIVRSGGKCERCGTHISGHGHFHHIKPRSSGGPDTPENLEFLCASCHSYVHRTDFEEKPAWVSARSKAVKRRVHTKSDKSKSAAMTT